MSAGLGKNGSTKQLGKAEFIKSTKNESFKHKKPNILFIMVDEMRHPPAYENKSIKKWRDKYLLAQKQLKREGVEFMNHYAGSTACAPSRATIFTGQYPTLHGVSQTDGAAKSAHDPDMFWLDPNTVPDMGDYFKQLNYETLYKGKWHVSHADILISGSTNSLPSYNEDGTVNKLNTEIYKNANRLDDYGFTGWIGPEPHGINPLNSGASSSEKINGRDIFYVDEVVSLLKKLDSKENNCSSLVEDNPKSQKPWLMVASLINPHDITLWGELTSHASGFNFDIDPSVPIIPPAPTSNDDLSTKPGCQQSYKERYQEGFQPTIDDETYRRLYYSLNLTADRNVKRILDALDDTDLADNTIVVFTSDHGDYVGAHGLFQKWYTSYQEAIHVPLIVRLPPRMHTPLRGKQIHVVTSHLDLLPTMLGLVNANTNYIQSLMRKTFSEVRPLVGRDLTRLIYNKKEHNIGEFGSPQLFMTDDNVLFGSNMVTITGKLYQPVKQPASIQTVIAFMCSQCCSYECDEEHKKLWKYSRYYDNPQFWTNPNVSNVIVIQSDGMTLAENSNIVINSTTTITKNQPLPDEHELYCLSNDPLEVINLADPNYCTSKSKKMQKKLDKILTKLVNEKCLVPNSKTV
jgi:arylsulfatase A-like enzyme